MVCDWDKCLELVTGVFGGESFCLHHLQFMTHGMSDPL